MIGCLPTCVCKQPIIGLYFEFETVLKFYNNSTGPRSTVGNVSGYRCVSDCRSRGCEFDPGLVYTFLEIDLEIISTVILNYSRRVVVSYKQKYVHKVLVNCLFKLAQEKVWSGELTVQP